MTSATPQALWNRNFLIWWLGGAQSALGSALAGIATRGGSLRVRVRLLVCHPLAKLGKAALEFTHRLWPQGGGAQGAVPPLVVVRVRAPSEAEAQVPLAVESGPEVFLGFCRTLAADRPQVAPQKGPVDGASSNSSSVAASVRPKGTR